MSINNSNNLNNSINNLKDPQIQQLLAEFKRVQQELFLIGPFRKGSIMKRFNICGNPKCRCRKDKKFLHGPYHIWTIKKKAKTQTITIPNELIPVANSYLENAKLFDLNIQKLADISEKILFRKINLIRATNPKSKQFVKNI